MLRIKFWGTRGSIPSPLSPDAMRARIRDVLDQFCDAGLSRRDQVEGFLKSLAVERYGGFGGNTACVEVNTGAVGTPGSQIIIDAGSGIRPLGYEMMRGPCGQGKGEVHLFFTHFHWDHLVGLPFFTPIFIPGNTIHVYAVQTDLKRVFETVFQKPYFPLNLDQLGAKLVYHELEPRKPYRVGELEVTPYQLDHPDPCWGYRVAGSGKVYSHCVDTEATRVSRQELGPDLPLYQGVDLMLFDAQYTLIEAIEKVNWGHAAASVGLDIAMREGIPRVFFMHNDPASSDEKIRTVARQARKYHDTQERSAKRGGYEIAQVDWAFVEEGTEVAL